jgi:tetratricopeptide (TPR) repeat protein
MSLLLDARKKLHLTQSAQEDGHASQASGLSLEEHPNLTMPVPDTKHPDTKQPDTKHHAQPIETARSAGQNLFAAKSAVPLAAHHGINRKLLAALGGTVLLLGVGAGYLWYLDSASTPQQMRPLTPQPAAPLARPPQLSPAAASPAPQKALVPEIALAATAKADIVDSAQKTPPLDKHILSEVEKLMPINQAAAVPVKVSPAASQPRKAKPTRPNNNPVSPKDNPIHIDQQRTELLDPLLRDAYFAYSSGKLDDAQQLYLAMFKKDASNTDSLLGLAAIAQQRGESQVAAQYYARVLVLDPRNAAANAGMSTLSTDDHNESRLKTLLREQGNSGALHFALGNLYAEQSRWGDAQQAYFNAYTLESGNAEFAFNLAVSLDHLGQNKLAAQHYQRALQLDRLNNAGFDHTQIEQRVQELTR